MLLFDLLISVFVRDFLTPLNRKHRILCEFVNIHTLLPPYECITLSRLIVRLFY